MIKVVAYDPDHLNHIKLKSCYGTECITRVGTDAITFLYDNKPIAIFGGIMLLPGVLQVWALISDAVRQIPLAFHKSVRLLIQLHFEKYGLRRMQMSVRTDNAEGWKWAKTLGFSCEGVMKKYGNDQTDYWLFARTA